MLAEKEYGFNAKATCSGGKSIEVNAVMNREADGTWDAECCLWNPDGTEAIEPITKIFPSATPKNAQTEAENWAKDIAANYLHCNPKDVTLKNVEWEEGGSL